ncbi:18356_t:CDS:1 [Dentiscutata erythropus]|uniref:18356_t:CDS:1 n=1 Tax=Dentiscutata erythropus TaxID=1348616 RepID=A0A9N9I6U8_9GLOM|nr:18356_t:CDS:1 [Dentiscutata erythropus]
MNIIEVKASYEKLASFEGGISDMSTRIQNGTVKNLQKRQASHYYTRKYSTNGTPYKTVIVTETAVPFIPPPDTVGTLTLYYPTCHVFACKWSFHHTSNTLSVVFSETPTPTTLTITEACKSSVSAQPYEDSNNSYPSDGKYVVLGTIGGVIVGILGGIALSFGIYKFKLKDEGIPTPSSAHHELIS